MRCNIYFTEIFVSLFCLFIYSTKKRELREVVERSKLTAHIHLPAETAGGRPELYHQTIAFKGTKLGLETGWLQLCYQT